MIIPSIDGGRNGSSNLYSRLLDDRIIFLRSAIDDNVANAIVAQLLYLESETPGKEISLYINSPGGSVTAGLAIYDTMRFIKSPVSTVAIGQAASMGAVLLAAGTKGRRLALPNSRILIHQPIGGVQGQATDILITAREIERLKKQINAILAECSGQPASKVSEDCERNKYMTAEEAMAYGLIDAVMPVYRGSAAA